jgi:hypothetical protein
LAAAPTFNKKRPPGVDRVNDHGELSRRQGYFVSNEKLAMEVPVFLRNDSANPSGVESIGSRVGFHFRVSL